MLRPPRLPRKIRAINALLRPVQRWLPQLSLGEETLLEAARRRTGLDDFGDDHFRQGLRVFLRALQAEAHLTPLGRVIARGEVGTALENRLSITDWRKRHPEIDAERIERPLIVIGMGRTGTTILHELLAQDPGNRVPLTWEVERPCPPPERASYQTDPRIAEADRMLDRTELLIPEFKTMHPMGAQLPQECVRILSNEFTSVASPLSYQVPSYARWLNEEADLGPAYRGHRRTLQLLQWRCPGRWVLKSPGHLWHLRALLREYPDALLVQTHRDPLRILASLTSLATTLRAMSSDAVNSQEIAQEWSQLNALAYDQSVEAREQGWIDPSRVLDLHFTEFLADPFAAIRRIYEFAGLPCTEDAERRMRAHWEAHPSDKHGKHRYRFADTGLDEAEERERVKRYQEYFQVPSEPL